MPEKLSPEINIEGKNEENSIRVDSEPLDSEKGNEARRTLGYMVEDKSGSIQRARGKKNSIYQDAGGHEFFAKYVSQRQGVQRNDIAGLTREKQILDSLKETGVVPLAGELKIYPSEQKARLLMEIVEGSSLDNPQFRETVLAGLNAASVIKSTALALEIVHAYNILITDLNPGTFIITEHDGQWETKVVDFEIAHDMQNETDEQLQSALQWFCHKDFGIKHQELNAGRLPLPERLKRSEMHLWGWVMAEWLLGERAYWQDIALTEASLEKVGQMDAQLGSIIRQDIQEQAKAEYATHYANDPTNYWATHGGEEAYIQREVAVRYKFSLREATAGLTFGERIQQAGIDLPPELVRFISATLSPYLQERPSSFYSL